MAVRIKSIIFDCADPYRVAQFWLQLTEFSEDPDNGNRRRPEPATHQAPAPITAGAGAPMPAPHPLADHPAKPRWQQPCRSPGSGPSPAAWSLTARPRRLGGSACVPPDFPRYSG
jgi:hypothetical protein